jgi:hypothetical protein
VWTRWCAGDLQGGPLPGGRFLPEESPHEVNLAVLGFLS